MLNQSIMTSKYAFHTCNRHAIGAFSILSYLAGTTREERPAIWMIFTATVWISYSCLT